MNHSLDAIFRPSTVAVIGASTNKGHIGQIILHNIIRGDFKGTVFPVNPNARVIHSIKCYPSVLDIPDPVDLAVIVVHRKIVEDVLKQCGEKGVKGVVVITAGYKEVGKDGMERERRLLEITKHYGMRMVGPNCFGILNTDQAVSLNATFSKRHPVSGNIGFLSQSGALGESILDFAHKLHLGFSMFASVGNKADISGNDLLSYWELDKQTRVILLYLENFGNPQNFIRITQRLSKQKPIIAVKAGKTMAGAQAVASHTGALSSFEVGIDALFNQCGVLRVSTVEELFNLAAAFSNQPLPRSKNVAVVTNAGGPGILATDAVVGLGLTMAELSQETKTYLRENLNEAASVNNPVDIIASGGADSYRHSLKAVLRDPNVDAVIVIFVPAILIDHMAVARAIAETVESEGNGKTILSCFMGDPQGPSGADELIAHNIPVYAFPEAAAHSLAAMTQYADWKNRPAGQIVSYDGDSDSVRKILDDCIDANRRTILGLDAMAILSAYGIPTAKSTVVTSADEIEQGISLTGLPLVMKSNDPEMIHKTEAKGVVIDLRSKAEVTDAFDRMKAQSRGPFAGVILQEMIRDGVETIIGMQRDRLFGPLMMFGLGGIFVEILKDVSFRIHPLTDLDVKDMVRSIRGFPLLEGFRGRKPVNLELLEEVILRLAQLAGDFPEIESIDINPFMAFPESEESKSVDARITLLSSGLDLGA